MKYILELEDEPNKEYFGEGNYYRCKQIPYWSISESMRNRLEPYDEADRKTEPQKKEVEWVYNKRERLWYPYSNGELLFKAENCSEIPNNCEDEPQTERSDDA